MPDLTVLLRKDSDSTQYWRCSQWQSTFDRRPGSARFESEVVRSLYSLKLAPLENSNKKKGEGERTGGGGECVTWSIASQRHCAGAVTTEASARSTSEYKRNLSPVPYSCIRCYSVTSRRRRTPGTASSITPTRPSTRISVPLNLLGGLCYPPARRS